GPPRPAPQRATGRIAATPAAVEPGLCTPAIPVRPPAIVEHDSLAYLSTRRDPNRPRWTLGAVGHGPAGARLAHRLTDEIQAWDTDRTAQPLITAVPAGTPGQPARQNLIKQHHIR